MKKVISILLLLLCGTVHAQWSPWANNVTRYGKYAFMVSGDSTAQMVYLMNPLPIIIPGVAQDSSLVDIQANQLILQGYLHPATRFFSNDSVSIAAGAIDSSLVFTGSTVFVQGQIFSINETIKAGFNKTFTIEPRMAYPYTATTKYEKFSPVTYTKIYVKNFGSTTAYVNYIFAGY